MYHLGEIPSETQIRKFLRRILYGKNIFCPACKSREVTCYEERYRCKRCRVKFSLISHTWLANLKISLQEFWLILWCWTTQIPVRQAIALTSLSEKGVRHWYDLFRNHLPHDQALLEAIIQLDEAYFGGWQGVTLLMGKQAGTRKLAWQILPHNQPARIDAYWFLKSYVKPKSILQTDGAAIYQEMERLFPITHQFEIHKEFKFTKTAEIEGMFGVLKTFIRRMYHHVTLKKLPELVWEFCYRFSHPEMFKNPRYYLKNSLVLVPTG